MRLYKLASALLLYLFSGILHAQETRLLTFPSDRSLGILYVGASADAPFDQLDLYRKGLEDIGPATGQVEVPRGAFVRLDISADAAKDLQPLANLPNDAIHFLNFDTSSPIAGQLKHIAHLESLRVLYLQSCPAKDSDIQQIAGLKNLESIRCSVYGFDTEGFGITDESLKIFGTFPKLKRLILRDNPVTDKGVSHLANCEQLETLSLSGSRVTGEGLNSLMMLQNLKSLRLGTSDKGSPLTHEGLRTFGNLLQLQYLDLSASGVNDQQLVQIGRLKQLKSLTLDYCNVTDAGLAALEGLDQLEKIRFYRDNGDLGDRAAEELAKLPNLKKVAAHWNLTPRGLSFLAQMKKLESIDLSDSVTDVEMESIAKMKGLKSLSLQNCMVTDTGIASLASMSQLERLALFRTQATTACLETVCKLPLKSFTLASVNEIFEVAPGKGWNRIAEMQRLERLSIHGFLIREGQWEVIGKLKNLESFECGSKLQMGTAAAKAISSLRNLTHLELEQCGFTAADADFFSGLHQLGSLNLYGDLETECIRRLAKLPALRRFQTSARQPVPKETVEEMQKDSPTLQMLRIGKDTSSPAIEKNGLILEGSGKARAELAKMIGKKPPRLIGVEAEFDLAAMKGTPVIVHFWKSRPYSDEVAPSDYIVNTLAKFPDDDIQVIGVHRSAGAKTMQRYIDLYGVTWPCFVDKANQTAKLWKNGGRGRDHIYLIDREGNLQAARVYIGDLENALRRLLESQN